MIQEEEKKLEQGQQPSISCSGLDTDSHASSQDPEFFDKVADDEEEARGDAGSVSL